METASQLSHRDLFLLMEYVAGIYEAREKEANRSTASQLREGDWVENVLAHPKLPAGARGHVIDVRREKIEVHFPDHGSFVVPAGVVRKVDGPTSNATK